MNSLKTWLLHKYVCLWAARSSHAGSEEVGRTPSQEAGGLGSGLGAKKLTLQAALPVLTCGTSLVLQYFKKGRAWSGSFPRRLFMPELVLSPGLCWLDLQLWSWYKYHTFSWTAYSLNTDQKRASWPKTRKLKTEIKRGGVHFRL